MYSETGIIEDCQNIYTSYLTGALPVQDSAKLLRKIDRMLNAISLMITEKSEEGGNTVFLEKIQADLFYIGNDLRTSSVSRV